MAPAIVGQHKTGNTRHTPAAAASPHANLRHYTAGRAGFVLKLLRGNRPNGILMEGGVLNIARTV
jgi:hypothetical protein